MVVVSTRYEFSQHFRVSAEAAFRWCTDYDPLDHALMGNKGVRKATWVSDETVILEDTLYPAGRAVTRTKVVKIDRERMSYYNFHLTGPNKNSLYVYRITPDGEGESRLDYTGYELSYPKRAPTKKQMAAAAEADEASRTLEWGRLAKAMEEELLQDGSS